MASGHVPVPAAIKAEVVFAVIVIVRHRTARLIVALAVILVGLVSWQEFGSGGGGTHHRTAWLLVMALAAVWCSRTMALGGAREAARMVGAGWWLVPLGRLAGAVALLLPFIGVLTVLLVAGRPGAPSPIRFALTGVLLGATTGAATMALTTLTGASAAASVAFLVAVFGGIEPGSFATLLGHGWAADLITRVWAVLPLQWRAYGWPDGARTFLLISATWLVVSLRLAGAAVAGPVLGQYVED